jgi:Flp pilus assembly pilin Flp
MQNHIHRWCGNEAGAAAIEYAMLLAVISLVIATSASIMAGDISSLFTQLGTALVNAFTGI